MSNVLSHLAGKIDYSKFRAASRSLSISESSLNSAGDTRTVPFRAVTLILCAEKRALASAGMGLFLV